MSERKQRTAERVNRLWYRSYIHPLLWLAIPLNWLFVVFSLIRRVLYRLGLKKTYRAPVPVIVVGNISVGGTGKTPLTMALVELLQRAGFKPGIVSRGYGGQGPFPHLISEHSDPQATGDEPYMLHSVTGVPVCVSPQRAEAIQHLLEHAECNVIISDDGLQHYAMGRDIEIAVVDATRGLGNGWRLPCGPLRESVRRLKRVDYVLLNGASEGGKVPLPTPLVKNLTQRNALIEMQIATRGWRRVSDSQEIETPDGESVIAIAGIGNPKRFFDLLEAEKLHITETRVFADHHGFDASDFFNVSNLYPIVMTEKDAVKCKPFARPHWYYLKVGAQLPESFEQHIIKRVQEHSDDT